MNETKKYSRKMEIVDSAHDIFRLKVPDGWVVSCFGINDCGKAECASVFIPDENHEWEIEHEYPRKYKYQIETINNDFQAYRMKLPKGWVVIYNSSDNSNMVYVPDADHKWVLEKE